MNGYSKPQRTRYPELTSFLELGDVNIRFLLVPVHRVEESVHDIRVLDLVIPRE